MTRPSGKPHCPDSHPDVELIDLPFPLPSRGIGTCPVSGVKFAFEIDLTDVEVVYDKFGQPLKRPTWKLTGSEAWVEDASIT